MQEKHTCINCGTIHDGAFCPNCGQKREIRRITIKSFILDFTSKWLGWDNKFLRTIKALTVNPGSVPREYIGGNRVRYVGPLGYTFLTTAIMIIMYNLLDLDIREMIQSSQDAFGANAGSSPPEVSMQEYNQAMAGFMADHFRFMVVAMIPFLALAGLMFYSSKDNGINYLEQSVLFFYIAGHTIWFNILSAPLLKIFGVSKFWMISIFSYSYTIWCIYSFHRRKGFGGFMRAFFSYLTGFVLFMFAFMIGIIIYMVFFTDIIQRIQESAAGAGGQQ